MSCGALFAVINLFEYENIFFDIALTTKQGLELFRNELYDIIVTDMGRGEESDAGIVLIKELKNFIVKYQLLFMLVVKQLENVKMWH